MLWKNLITALVRYAEAHPEDPLTRALHVRAGENDRTIKAYLEQRFDIREVGKLRALNPRAFPKPLRRGPLESSTNTRGEWKVEAVEPPI